MNTIRVSNSFETDHCIGPDKDIFLALNCNYSLTYQFKGDGNPDDYYVLNERS